MKTCPRCGGLFDDSTTTCPICDFDFSSAAREEERRPPTEVKKTCPHCGGIFDASTATCPICGYDFSSVSREEERGTGTATTGDASRRGTSSTGGTPRRRTSSTGGARGGRAATTWDARAERAARTKKALKYVLCTAAVLAIVAGIVFLAVSGVFSSLFTDRVDDAENTEIHLYADDGTYIPTSVSSHTHVWQEADCTHPKTCIICGDTEGNALGHSFTIAANCTKPKTCSRCGASTGSPLGHNYTQATCQRLATCVRCGATTGGFAAHDYAPATYTAPKTCRVCGATAGSPLKATSTPTPRPTSTPTPKPVTRKRTAARSLGTGIVYLGTATANDHFENEYGRYYASNAFDGDNTTSWVHRLESNNIQGVWLSNTWILTEGNTAKYNACGLKIRIGLQSRGTNGQDSFNDNSRPKEIYVTVNGRSAKFTLSDIMSDQYIYFNSEVAPQQGRFNVKIEVRSVYTGQMGAGKTNENSKKIDYDICIAEVDLILINNY